jgi:coniferyl-aldehyde dehydrogenase
MTLDSLLQHHQQQFNAESYPALAVRRQRLQRLAELLKHYSGALQQAVSTDFGQRSQAETQLLEIAPSLQGIKYQLAHLKRWLKPQRRAVHYTFAPAKNFVLAQPLGVVGIIVPWNYPIFLALSPLMAALAAGNQVLLKLSEFTPATNAVLAELLAEGLSDCVSVVQGDAQVAAAFAALPFDHLLFTGSTGIGRKVMQAAAANLTPVTLELGGKSPALLTANTDLKHFSQRLLFGKTANAGQTCVAPDYVLVPKAKIPVLISQLQADFAKLYPDFATNPDYSAVINPLHYQRLQQLLAEALGRGATAYPCAVISSEQQQQTRRLPLTLLVDVPEECQILQQEIFGPLLPIIGYDDLEQALNYIRARPRPLALYLFSEDKAVQQQVLTQSHAGGVCINDTLLHVAQEDLPFGGVGPSGLGNYHGPEGFWRFSHAKAVHQKGRFSSSVLIYPPFNRPLFKALLQWLMR